METIFLLYVPIALLVGFAFHHALFRSRVPSGQPPKLTRRLMVAGLPLFYLLVWVALCYGFKLLTWKPFGGDTPGSVESTNVLLLAGSALAGVWISARMLRRKGIQKS